MSVEQPTHQEYAVSALPRSNPAPEAQAPDLDVEPSAPGGAPAAPVRRGFGWRWIMAAVLAIASMGLRAALDPWLGGGLPFVFAFPALAAAALLAGTGPALVALAICCALPQVPAVAAALGVTLPWRQTWLFALSGLGMVLVCRWFARQGARPLAEVESTPDGQGRHIELWLRLLIVLALLLPAGFFASAAWQGWRSAFGAAQERVSRSVVVAREHALRIMHMDELIFDQMRLRLDGKTAAEIDAQPGMQQALALMVQGLPDVQSVAAWDREGRPLALSRPLGTSAAMDASARDFFRAQREADRGMFTSAPVPSPVKPGEWRIFVSQRRLGANGEFDGVYAIALRAGLFADFYRELLRDEPGGTVALMRRDGTVVAREPAPPTQGVVLPKSNELMSRIAAGASSGFLTATSPLDGRDRLVAFRQVDSYPLYVTATVGRGAVLAAWYREMSLLAAFTFPTALALAWVSWLAVRHTGRERAALQRWRAETVKRAQVEDALRQTQRLEALGHLTGGVAHDVNNLLMVVSNNAYLLRRLLTLGGSGAAKEMDPRVEKPIDAILRAVTTGARLTRQLLAFARRQALRPEVLQLQERMPTLVDLMRHSVSSNVTVEGMAEPGTDCIQVDPAELELALINLAVNARDAMPEGGRLRVQARNALPSEHQGLGRWISITVQDTGSGMPPEVLERVFEPFFTTKEQGKGTGLGLSQVYGFCQQAGGVARISSKPGAGTTVQLVLPAAAGVPELGEALPPVPSAEGRLLLVEDNAEVAEATEPMLSSWGYSVRAARTGDSAKELLRQHEGAFELLLTDIVMPGSTDGLSLARHVRQLYPHIGIVLMTGHARETDKAMSEGFVVLQKPWTPAALAAALEQAHPRQRAQAA